MLNVRCGFESGYWLTSITALIASIGLFSVPQTKRGGADKVPQVRHYRRTPVFFRGNTVRFPQPERVSDSLRCAQSTQRTDRTRAERPSIVGMLSDCGVVPCEADHITTANAERFSESFLSGDDRISADLLRSFRRFRKHSYFPTADFQDSSKTFEKLFLRIEPLPRD